MKPHPLMWAKRVGDELYIFRAGKVIYKKWFTKNGKKKQPSVLFNENGWPNEDII